MNTLPPYFMRRLIFEWVVLKEFKTNNQCLQKNTFFTQFGFIFEMNKRKILSKFLVRFERGKPKE